MNGLFYIILFVIVLFLLYIGIHIYLIFKTTGWLSEFAYISEKVATKAIDPPAFVYKIEYTVDNILYVEKPIFSISSGNYSVGDRVKIWINPKNNHEIILIQEDFLSRTLRVFVNFLTGSDISTR